MKAILPDLITEEKKPDLIIDFTAIRYNPSFEKMFYKQIIHEIKKLSRKNCILKIYGERP